MCLLTQLARRVWSRFAVRGEIGLASPSLNQFPSRRLVVVGLWPAGFYARIAAREFRGVPPSGRWVVGRNVRARCAGEPRGLPSTSAASLVRRRLRALATQRQR